jgi:hypothetical protein
VEEQEVHDDHEEGLDEQRGAEVGAEPVEDFEDRGDEHDERDVEGEAGGRPRAVHAVDLVAIAGYGAGGDAGIGVSVGGGFVWCEGVQDGRDVRHNGADEEHLVVVCAVPVRSERRRAV